MCFTAADEFQVCNWKVSAKNKRYWDRIVQEKYMVNQLAAFGDDGELLIPQNWMKKLRGAVVDIRFHLGSGQVQFHDSTWKSQRSRF
jgi:hypothetical protein